MIHRDPCPFREGFVLVAPVQVLPPRLPIGPVATLVQHPQRIPLPGLGCGGEDFFLHLWAVAAVQTLHGNVGKSGTVCVFVCCARACVRILLATVVTGAKEPRGTRGAIVGSGDVVAWQEQIRLYIRLCYYA